MLDFNILYFIQENLRFEWLTPFMKGVTWLANPIGAFSLFGFVLLLIPRTRKYGAVILIALLIDVVIVNLGLKNIVQRTRPYERFPEIIRLIEKQSDYSFPSGHSGMTMSTSTALLLSLPKEYKFIGYLMIVLSVVICYSRLYLGVHYPSDVLAGMLIGIFSGVMAWIAGKRWIFKDNHELKD